MAQLLSRMARDGLIRRELDPSDRRSLVSLTKDTLARLPAGRAVLLQGNKEATRGFSAAEIRTLIDRILVNVEALEERTLTSRRI